MYQLEEFMGEIDLSWVTAEKRQTYELIAAVLGQIYRQTKWKNIARSKIATDVFEHRIKNSSRKQTVPAFVNKLCRQLSIQAMHEQPEIIFQADQIRESFLNTIRSESQLCVMLARRHNQLKKQERENEND